MTAARRVDASQRRGLRRVESTGGATLYHVVFGERRGAGPRARVDFDDIDEGERRSLGWRGWAFILGAHLVLILMPIIHHQRAPAPPEGETREGMTVDLVVEPGRATRDALRSVPVEGRMDKPSPRDARPTPKPVEASQAPAAVAGTAAAQPAIQLAPALAVVRPAAEEARAAPVAEVASVAGARSRSSEEERWEGEILGRIAARRRYPAAALDAAVEDVVILRLVIDRQGRVLNVELVRSRGNPALDREVLALARRASPYPRPPASVVGETISMLVPVEFVMKRRR